MRELFLGKKVWIYRSAIDFRRQINGLVQVVIESGQSNPTDGSVYVFRNRKKDKVKLLTWHVNGFFLGYKRLERGRFDFPEDKEVVQLSPRQLMQLLSGMPMLYVGKGSESTPVFS